MKKLPININPYIRAYTEYAYVDMIMNNEETNGRELVRGCVSEKFDNNWIISSEEAQIFIDENRFSVEEDYKAFPRVKHIYRKLKRNDEIVLKIEYQQYTNKWDSVGLFLDHFPVNLDDYFMNQAVLGSYCGSIFMSIIRGVQRLILETYEKKQYPIWLKIVVRDSTFELYYGIRENQWIMIERREQFIDWDEKEYFVGIFVSLSDRQYYKWIFNNFINLRLDLTDTSTLNYCGFVKRDCKNYTINPIVRFSTEKLSVIEKYKIDIWDFIVGNIDDERYIEFWLNEKYVPGLKAYNSNDYVHESLVYGYDDSTKTIFMVSILNGKPTNISINLFDFKEALMFSNPRLACRCYLFERQPSNAPYELDIDSIVNQLKEYCAGVNPTIQYKRLITEEQGVFGVACYDLLIDDIEARNRLLYDVRISYVLSEHKKCMKDRIDYLINRGYLDKKRNSDIEKMIQDIYNKAISILQLVLKYQEVNKESIKTKIFILLKEIQAEEIKCYQLLIERLI